MFKVKRLVLFVTIVVGVSGCSVLLDTSKFIPWQTDAELSGDYKNAIEADAITVPEDLDSASVQQPTPFLKFQ